MYRFDEQRNVCGVLNDMDLSFDLVEDSKETLLLRTGTPPFMAIDLLREYSLQPEHIYRHDLESLFYVMLTVFTRYELIATEPTSQDHRARRLLRRIDPLLSEWFDSTTSWERLSKEKELFFTSTLLFDSPH